MNEDIQKLCDEEKDLLFEAPLLVSILIAGADNNIDKSEIKEAINLAKSNSKESRSYIVEYYKLVAENFDDKLNI